MTAQQDWITEPGGIPRGRLRIPGDKSISHRAVMLGALACGDTRISGFLDSADCLATLAVCQAMGVSASRAGDVLTVHGVGLHGLQAPTEVLDVGNSGTSMRLLAGLLSGQAFDSELTGDDSLRRRPMARVMRPLRSMGAAIEGGDGDTAPLRITGGQPLVGIDYPMPVASAQVKSCLLLAGLYAQGVTRIVEPAPCRDHTERMLEAFGVAVPRDRNRIELRGGQRLVAREIGIPADLSSAAFFLTAAAVTPGADLVLEGVGVNPTRTGVLDILRLMGADISDTNAGSLGGEPVADLRVRGSELHGIDIDPALVPLAIDEFPAIFVAAACAQGVTTLRGAAELRVKESDRIGVMAEGLTSLGIDAQVLEDGIRIQGGRVGGGRIDSHGDHRIAMSFAAIAGRAEGPLRICKVANVATSFPNFAELGRSVGLSINEPTE